MTYRTLSYRREHPHLFLAGSYISLESVGPRHTHICAFARQYEQQVILAITPRFVTRLVPDPCTPPLGPRVWEDAWLMPPSGSAGRRYRNLFIGESVTVASREEKLMLALGEVFAYFPVALLVGEAAVLPSTRMHTLSSTRQGD